MGKYLATPGKLGLATERQDPQLDLSTGDRQIDEQIKVPFTLEDVKFLRQLKIDPEIKIMSEHKTGIAQNIFEKYSEKAKRVLFFARYEASQIGSAYIGAEHILLGVTREDKYLVNRFVTEPGIFLDDVRELINAKIPPAKKISTSIELPFSNEAKKVLSYAHEEAEKLSHNRITPGHLLLGLVRVGNSITCEILTKKGVSLPAVRRFLQETS